MLDLMEKVALAARYADVVTVLQDYPRFSADRSKMTLMQEFRREGPFKGAPTMLTSDPPVQTRLRRLFRATSRPSESGDGSSHPRNDRAAARRGSAQGRV